MQVYSLILPVWELCTLLPLLILSLFRAQLPMPRSWWDVCGKLKH